MPPMTCEGAQQLTVPGAILARRRAHAGRSPWTECRLSPSQLRNWSGFAIVVVGAGILLATLTPISGAEDGCPLGLPCLAWHFGLFAAFGVAIAARYATSEAARRSPRRVLGMVALAIWVFAAATEIGQGWVDGRDPELVDWLANMAGAVAGLLLGSVALRWLLTER